MFKSNARTGNFTSAGKSAADDMVRSFAAARRNAPKYGEMAQKATQIRSKEKIAAMKAEQEVALAGIKAQTAVRKNKIEVKAESELKGAKRKAGVLATAGKMFSDAGTMYGESKDITLRDTSDSAYDNSAIDSAQDALDTANANVESVDNNINPETGNPYGQRPAADTDTDTNTDTDTDTDTNNDGGGVDLTEGATRRLAPISSAQANGGAGGTMSRQQLEKVLTSNGMTPDNARILSAIGMGESGGNPTIDTVQSGLDPNKNNEFSVGLFQINTQAHQDKLNRRGWTADDLRDPNKNAQIAIEVFNEAGGKFTPWSVYNSGDYRQYL